MTQDEVAGRLQILKGNMGRFHTSSIRNLTSNSTGPSHPAAPLNLAMLDHITASVQEVKQAVRETPTATAATPVPTDVAGIYDWWRASTPEIEGERRLERERVIYRQGLEHAIEAGDHKVVRPHPCPACGCWGLHWRAAQRRAVCVNHDCVDDDGLANTWELKHLAYEHIARQEKRAVRAT